MYSLLNDFVCKIEQSVACTNNVNNTRSHKKNKMYGHETKPKEMNQIDTNSRNFKLLNHSFHEISSGTLELDKKLFLNPMLSTGRKQEGFCLPSRNLVIVFQHTEIQNLQITFLKSMQE